MGGEREKTSLPFWQDFLCEIGSALCASFMVAPAISIIDRSIISNAAGTQNLWSCAKDGFLELVQRPLHFVRQTPFRLIWGVYGVTYIAANSIELACSRTQTSPVYPKFVGGSIVNVSASVAKDRIFTRMFGRGTPRPVPLPSYLLFCTRDSMTILASFTLPDPVAAAAVKHLGISASTAGTLSQLFVPCIMQFFSVPLHLLGLDLYNRDKAFMTQQGFSSSSKILADRVAFIRREYLKTCAARIGRIFPAFGIGGVLNKKLRATSKAYLQQ